MCICLDRVEMALLTQDKYFFVAFVTHVYLQNLYQPSVHVSVCLPPSVTHAHTPCLLYGQNSKAVVTMTGALTESSWVGPFVLGTAQVLSLTPTAAQGAGAHACSSTDGVVPVLQ